MKFIKHFEQFVRGWQIAFRNFLAVLVLCSMGGAILAGHAVAASSYPDPSRVLVVYKINDIDANGNGIGDSLELAQYYAAKRNVPQANLLGVNVSVSSYYYYTGQYGLFYSDLVAPIRAKLASLGAENIDVILLAGALPTVVYDGSNTVYSVDNALMGINVLGSAANSLITGGSNPYFALNPGFSADVGHFNHASFKYLGTDMYLVTHLGSAASLGGFDKVAQSAYADKYVYPHPGYYYGTAYVDSQWGMPNGQPYTDAYLSGQTAVRTGDYSSPANADLNIAYAEHWITAAGFPLKWENTTNALRIGDPGAMFSDGTSALTAPRALFYGGWYNFDNYNNVYQWLAGSIACDLNSALTFGTQALLHGASAASYVVSEPNLNGHQRPDIIYYYILKGYDFAEASALATPFIGWMAVNEGDPLYAPNQLKTPVVDTAAPVLEAGYPQVTVSPVTGITTVNLPIDDSQGPEVVTAMVNYGPNANYGTVANSSPGFSRTPSVSLPSTAGQTYHYQVTLTDPVGNIWTSGDFTFAGNAPPTIASAVSATPSPVTGTIAAVTVLGADDGGESNLTYIWSATGPAPVAFNTNGTNASKNSTAVFTKAGAYSLRVVVTDSFGSTVTSSTNVTVSPTASQVVVVPPSASVSILGTQQFSANVNDQFGNAIGLVPVAWSVTGGGIMLPTGLFTAGIAVGGPFTVSASSGSLSGTSSVTVIPVDITPPTVPANVSASAVSPSAINVGWIASTDNVGVAGYRIYRNGTQVGTSASTTYADANLVPNTTYSYTVSAYDAAGNVSAQSAPASATIQGGLTTALLIAGTPAELGLAAGTASAATNSLSLSPSINTYGLTGTLQVNGTGSVNYVPGQNGNGVYFLNCCANTSNAYYKFMGAAIGSLFNTNQGEVSFYLQSRFSFAQRQASASSPRYAFDVRDGNGHLFYFATQVVSGSLEFSYEVAGASQYYYAPKGTEDTLYGNGVGLQVTLNWTAGAVNLYLNGTLVKSSAYTSATPSWTSASNFDFGAYEYLTYGGYNASDDAIAQFTVFSKPGGSTAPAISIVTPSSGAAVAGTVTVTANATDSAGVTGVQFKLDGTNLGSMVTGVGPVYSTSWNAAAATNGPHTLTAVATDAAGNTATSSVSVTVSSVLPVVSITAPVSGALLNGTTTVTANATDSAGVTGVQFKLDGINLGNLVMGVGPAYSVSWNAAASPNGPHMLTAVATDAAGNTASSSVSVTVDTIPPAISLTAPASGAYLNGLATVTANVTDSVRLTGVQFKLDGINLGGMVTGAGPIYSTSWNAALANSGPHTLTAVATDAAGNTASSTVSVTVSTAPPVVSLSVPTVDALVTASDRRSVLSAGLRLATAPSSESTNGAGPRSEPFVEAHLSAPASSVSVSGAITITANASDPIPLMSLQFQLDGVNLGSAIPGRGPAYSLTWNTITVSNGVHILTALAVDTAGNVGTSSRVSVTVTNPLLLINGNAAEVSGMTKGSVVTPTVAPTGFRGSVVVNGTGSVNYAPAQNGNGVYFLNCCGNTNNAYYEFTGAAIGSLFSPSQGQVSFYLQSRYSFAQRQASTSSKRYAFDVRDGNGHLFYFLTEAVSGRLMFTYAVAGASEYYYVPQGTENALYGNGVGLQVTLSWNGGIVSLYLNGKLVKSATYTSATPNWTASSNFDLGAYEYLTFGGYDVSDDVIAQFAVIPVPQN